jgi:membrane-bound serine protease (ClpP class)
LAFVGILSAGLSAVGDAPVSSKAVAYVARIEGMIDMGLGPFVDRVLREAQAANASVVVLDINTFGGRVDAAVAIRDHLLGSPVPTVAFINKRAISAGALISLAAEKIGMARGGTIGAATPVQMGQPGEEASPAGEKTVSYVRKEFRATADARKRPGLITEAMVDADVEIEGIIEKGKLLTLTTEEALEHGVADFEAETVRELLGHLGHGEATLVLVRENWAEQVVRFLTHPVVASLLMTLAILGIIIELRTPGFGVPGAIGILSLASFFWGHWLVKLVGWEQVLLVVAGAVLIALEAFVIPGFGIAGVLGMIALVAGLSSSLFGTGASIETMVFAVLRVAISLVAALIAGFLLWRVLRVLPLGRRLVLGAEIKGAGRAEPEEQPLLDGVVGTALTPLRPAGIASLAGRRIDVVSLGDFIESGAAVEVVRDEGNRVVVRALQVDPERKEGSE